jgi:hypothetical protein
LDVIYLKKNGALFELIILKKSLKMADGTANTTNTPASDKTTDKLVAAMTLLRIYAEKVRRGTTPPPLRVRGLGKLQFITTTTDMVVPHCKVTPYKFRSGPTMAHAPRPCPYAPPPSPVTSRVDGGSMSEQD